jgi:hypothetical protein
MTRPHDPVFCTVGFASRDQDTSSQVAKAAPLPPLPAGHARHSGAGGLSAIDHTRRPTTLPESELGK